MRGVQNLQKTGQESHLKELGPAPLVDTDALEAQRVRRQQELMELMESQQVTLTNQDFSPIQHTHTHVHSDHRVPA